MNKTVLGFTLALLVCPTLITLVGCKTESESSRNRNRANSEVPESSDNLALAMQFLNLSDDLDPERARAQCAYHLNRWLETREPDKQWLADPQFARLPKAVRGDHTSQSLGRLRFTLYDVRYIQQAQWARDVSKWVALRLPPENIQTWIDSGPEGLSQEDAEQLAVAERLLDWTVRNIQLETLLDYPAGTAAGPDGKAGNTSPADSLLPSARGEPGPGYTYWPWQIMLYGRGDSWQRARVFILLCRQVGIDAVMLAVDDPTMRPTPKPWLPAVVLGDSLYLFDTHLGMPIRGPESTGVATLKQVQEDPSLLESLDVGEKYKYPVRGPQLDKIVALVDAPAMALSQRMSLVEQQLSGDEKLVLTVSPSEIVKRLSALDGIESTRIWSVPFEVDLFRQALPGRIAQQPELAVEFFRKESIFEGSHPLVAGRRRAFRGEFESSDDETGAKSLYLEARLPDNVIENLATNSAARMRVGMDGPLPDDPNRRNLLLNNARILLREGKITASLWLGIAQFETERFDDALEWLDEKTLQNDQDERWLGSARYNIGRTHEELGNFDAARDVYFADQSPQAHGNRLRARYFPSNQASGDSSEGE